MVNKRCKCMKVFEAYDSVNNCDCPECLKKRGITQEQEAMINSRKVYR